jgi:hypothetical protein
MNQSPLVPLCPAVPKLPISPPKQHGRLFLCRSCASVAFGRPLDELIPILSCCPLCPKVCKGVRSRSRPDAWCNSSEAVVIIGGAGSIKRSTPSRTRKVVCSQDEKDDRALKEAFNLFARHDHCRSRPIRRLKFLTNGHEALKRKAHVLHAGRAPRNGGNARHSRWLEQRKTVRLQFVQDRHASNEQDQKFQ